MNTKHSIITIALLQFLGPLFNLPAVSANPLVLPKGAVLECDGLTKSDFYLDVPIGDQPEGYPDAIIGPVADPVLVMLDSATSVSVKSRADAQRAITAGLVENLLKQQFKCKPCLPDTNHDGVLEPGKKFIDPATLNLAGSYLVDFNPETSCEAVQFEDSFIAKGEDEAIPVKQIILWKCTTKGNTLNLGLLSEEGIKTSAFANLGDADKIRQLVPFGRGGCEKPPAEKNAK